MPRDFECPLCKAEKITEWFYDSSLFWIANCATCQVPMVVLKEHRADVERWIIDEMIQVSKSIFDIDKFDIDFEMRQIKGHFHFHLRPKKIEKVNDEEEREEEENAKKVDD